MPSFSKTLPSDFVAGFEFGVIAGAMVLVAIVVVVGSAVAAAMAHVEGLESNSQVK